MKTYNYNLNHESTYLATKKKKKNHESTNLVAPKYIIFSL